MESTSVLRSHQSDAEEKEQLNNARDESPLRTVVCKVTKINLVTVVCGLKTVLLSLAKLWTACSHRL